jgi:transposase
MEFFSGLDVAMERTAICVVDDKGGVQMQTEIVTDPDAIAAALRPFLPRLRRVVSAQRNKTNATDALALAHVERTGWFRRAHIKTESCYRLRLLLTQRRNLKRKVLDLANTIRHSLKAFGIRIKGTGRTGFDAAVREAVVGDALTSELMDAMLAARAML